MRIKHFAFLFGLAVICMFLIAPVAYAATGNWADYAASSYADGDGSVGNPFQIATAEQLAFLAYNTNADPTYSAGKYFVLIGEIDLTAHYWVPVGEFRGNFDGRSHKILNLTINNGSVDYQGLFGQLTSGASISNLGIVNCNIMGQTYNGALAAYATVATITNCYSTGTINGYAGNGGLVGGVGSASLTIANSWSSCSVTGRLMTANVWTGGFLGPVWDGNATITNCYSTGDVQGFGNSGAFVALSYNSSLTISNCYSTGNITTPSGHWNNVGGIVGLSGPGSRITISNCYHSGITFGSDDTGKTGGIIGGRDGGSSVSVTNSYYNSASPAGQGGGTAMATADMKTAGFVMTLNASQAPAPWMVDTVNANNGFPILFGMPGIINFISQIGMPLSTTIVSNPVTVDFIGTDAPISITGGEYSISADGDTTWSGWTNTAGTVSLNNQVMARLTSAASNSTLTTATLTIGSTIGSFNVTTAAAGDLDASGLVAWWRAENNAYDSVGGNHGAAMNGATYTAGPIGQAFSFDGNGSYVTVPASSKWAFGTTDFTISFLAYSSTNDDHRPIINNRKTPASENMWAIEIYPVANRVEFHSGGTIFLTASNLLTSSSWNHIAVTRSGSTLYMYINGVLSGSVGNSTDFSEINDLQIARDIMSGNQLGGRTFGGIIDEVKIFNRALSAAEVSKFAGTYPDPFSFIAQTGIPLNTSIVSNPITVTGITSAAAISINGNDAQYSVSTDGGSTRGSWTSASSTVSAGNMVMVRQASSSSNSMLTTTTLNIGGATADFNVTTAADGDPDASGLVAWWRAENNAFDAVGGNNGTLQGSATFGNGKVGQAFSFDGGGQVIVPVSASLGMTSAYTFDAWVDSTSGLSGDDRLIAARGLDTSGNDNGHDIEIKISSPAADNTLQVMHNRTNGGTAAAVQFVAPPINQFFHLTVMYDGTVVRAYYNGVEASTTSGPNTIAAPLYTNRGWIFGKTTHTDFGGFGAFYGLLDEIKMFNRTLSAAEVSKLSGTYPDAFSFTAQTGMPLSTTIVSNPITISGISSAAAISITGVPSGAYQINGGSWTASAGTVSNGDIVKVRQTSSSSNSATTTATLTIGGVTADFDVTTAASDDPNANGLVAWWKAENNAYDSFGGNNGTLQGGATFASGKVGQAFSFDGVNGYVNVPHNDSLNPSGDQTISLWVNFGALPADYKDIIQTGLGPQPYVAQYVIRTNNSNGMDFQWCSTSRCYIVNGLPYSTLGVTAGSWYHIDFVINSSGDTAYIYINGIQKGSTTGTSGSYGPNTAALTIGGFTWDGYFPGLVDEVKIYNRALSDTEVSKLAGTYPNAFSFTSQTGVPLSTVVESNAITVTGINAPAAISINGGEYSVSSNGGSTWSAYSPSVPATVSLNDQVKVHQTSSAGYATTTTATLTIGGRSGTFSVTTIPITLTITKDGTGGGTVTSNLGGINCGSTCSAGFTAGDSVNIGAAAHSDSSFIRWGGGTCSGNASPCSLTMNSPTTVTATFNLKTDFNAAPRTGYGPMAVQFTDASMDGTAAWSWSFGDGGSSTEKNPIHMYRNAGTYDVSLTANGMTTTKTGYIVVNTGCGSEPVKIFGTSAQFTKLSDVFAAALADSDVIEAQAFDNPDNSLTYANPHAVTLRGGYDCGFTVNPDFTTVNGKMTISGGPVTVENMMVK